MLFVLTPSLLARAVRALRLPRCRWPVPLLTRKAAGFLPSSAPWARENMLRFGLIR